MNRLLLRQLSEERANEALVLLDASQWSGAYDLTGYAVECALKACIARKTAQDDFPEKDFVVRSHTHNLESLVVQASLDVLLKTHQNENSSFRKNWSAVKSWNERARYSLWTEIQARNVYQAAIDPNEGVLVWIKPHWSRMI